MSRRGLSVKAKTILNRLVEADGPISLEDLIDGVTDSEGSFRVYLCNLRAAGYEIEPVRMFKISKHSKEVAEIVQTLDSQTPERRQSIIENTLYGR